MTTLLVCTMLLRGTIDGRPFAYFRCGDEQDHCYVLRQDTWEYPRLESCHA